MLRLLKSFGLKSKLIYYYSKKFFHYKIKFKINKLKNIYKEKNDTGSFFLPRIVHIETRTKCSGGCSFCLASYKTDPREDGLMSENIVHEILNQLSELNYSNRLSFYNNNEPFLDKRIYSFIEIARKKLPNSFLELKTNAKGLKIENILEIFSKGLDYLYINDYVDLESFRKKKHSKNVERIKNELKKIRRFKGNYFENNTFERIDIGLRYEGAVLNTRAGTAPNRNVDVNSNYKKFKSNNWICFRPFEMITINREGDVALCSEDLLYEEKMGNVKTKKIVDIWFSEKYKKVRYELLNGNRKHLTTCSKCDYKGYALEAFLENNL